MCEKDIGTSVANIVSYILSHREPGLCDVCIGWVGNGTDANPVIIAISRLGKILEDPHQHESDKSYAEHILVDLMRNEDESVCLDYVDKAYAELARIKYSLSEQALASVKQFEAEPENSLTVEMVSVGRL